VSDERRTPLVREDLAGDPVAQFREWLERARATRGLDLLHACCLATVDDEGYPDARMVLLKGVDEEGLVSYTNLRSRKAESLRDRPRAALVFHWKPLGRQVRLKGDAAPVSEEEADRYFASRPRGSQIAAWASEQSEPVDTREALEERFRQTGERYEGEAVPRPPFWSGFRIKPTTVEFWQERDHRLHDRFVYRRTRHGWEVVRLQP
jgi:pyridoxamine 5'-phosphate oxidase